MVLGEVIGKSEAEQERINSELSVGEGEDFTILDIQSESISLATQRVKEYEQSVAGSNLVWGNPDYGIWGSFYWADDFSEPYIVKAVYNDENYFPEGFWNDRFINETLSTGTYISGSEYYLLEPGQIFHTDTIAKEDKIYKQVLININSINAHTGSSIEDDLIIFASNNGNLSYQSITRDVNTILINGNTDGLSIKIACNCDATPITIPITMPLTFGLKNIIIQDFNVKYA